MIVAMVDRDFLNLAWKKDGGEYGNINRRGTTWVHDEFPGIQFVDGATHTRFRCKDDDGEHYYGGWLINDPMCVVQQAVLAWAMHDAGCTTIEVKINDEWTQEIS